MKLSFTLEQKYGIFLVNSEKFCKKAKDKEISCICDKFYQQDEVGMCKGNRFEKRKRTKEMREKMLQADEKREERIKIQEEKELRRQTLGRRRIKRKAKTES
jgi:hypothetical protein